MNFGIFVFFEPLVQDFSLLSTFLIFLLTVFFVDSDLFLEKKLRLLKQQADLQKRLLEMQRKNKDAAVSPETPNLPPLNQSIKINPPTQSFLYSSTPIPTPLTRNLNNPQK